jgi:hypothetical protein
VLDENLKNNGFIGLSIKDKISVCSRQKALITSKILNY